MDDLPPPRSPRRARSVRAAEHLRRTRSRLTCVLPMARSAPMRALSPATSCGAASVTSWRRRCISSRWSMASTTSATSCRWDRAHGSCWACALRCVRRAGRGRPASRQRPPSVGGRRSVGGADPRRGRSAGRPPPRRRGRGDGRWVLGAYLAVRERTVVESSRNWRRWSAATACSWRARAKRRGQGLRGRPACRRPGTEIGVALRHRRDGTRRPPPAKSRSSPMRRIRRASPWTFGAYRERTGDLVWRARDPADVAGLRKESRTSPRSCGWRRRPACGARTSTTTG